MAAYDANEFALLPLNTDRHAFKIWNTVEKDGTTPSATPSIPPVITLVSPTLGTIGLQTAIALETTDEANAFKRIVLVAEFPTSKIKEIVYDGAGFGPMYTNPANVSTPITNGYHFDILRDGGWIANDGPVLTPFVIDTSGGEAA